MARYRKKPVVIEAEQWHGSPFSIPTLEGVMTVGTGDWVITGVQGERYPCKPDIFAATYEPAESCECGESETCEHCFDAKVFGGAT